MKKLLLLLSLLSGCSTVAFAGNAMVNVKGRLPVRPWPAKVYVPSYQVTLVPNPVNVGNFPATIWRSSIFPTRSVLDSRQGYVTITGVDNSPTPTNSYTNTPTYTYTPTFTPTFTPTNTYTGTFTPAAGTNTNTNTATMTFTNTLTNTPTFTKTSTPTFTSTYFPVRGVSISWDKNRSKLQTLNMAQWSFSMIMQAPINTQTPTFTCASSWTPGCGNQNSATPTITSTPTNTRTITPTFTWTGSATPTNTPTATSTPTNTFTCVASSSMTPCYNQLTNTFTPTITSTATNTPTNTPIF